MKNKTKSWHQTKDKSNKKLKNKIKKKNNKIKECNTTKKKKK